MVYPTTNPEHIQNRMVEVNLSEFFFHYEKENQANLYRRTNIQQVDITREERIEALEKDAREFAFLYSLEAQLHFYRITPRMLAEDYISRQ